MSKTITIKNLIIEIEDEESCQNALRLASIQDGLSLIAESKNDMTTEDFLKDFVELNQCHGLFLGFDDCDVMED